MCVDGGEHARSDDRFAADTVFSYVTGRPFTSCHLAGSYDRDLQMYSLTRCGAIRYCSVCNEVLSATALRPMPEAWSMCCVSNYHYGLDSLGTGASTSFFEVLRSHKVYPVSLQLCAQASVYCRVGSFYEAGQISSSVEHWATTFSPALRRLTDLLSANFSPVFFSRSLITQVERQIL